MRNKTSIRLVLVLIAISLLSCNNQSAQNMKTFNIDSSTNNHININRNKDINSIEKVVGNWCFQVRDSLNFSLTLLLKNDSLFGTYSCVLFGGKYLNAFEGDEDWAFKMPAKSIFDSTNVINGKNYSNDEAIKIKVFYDAKNNTLTWTQLDDDEIKKYLLPTLAVMNKCK